MRDFSDMLKRIYISSSAAGNKEEYLLQDYLELEDIPVINLTENETDT